MTLPGEQERPSHDHESGSVHAGPIERWIVIALLGALVLRTIADPSIKDALPWYAGLLSLYVILFAFAWSRIGWPRRWVHTYLGGQSVIVLAVFALNPKMDSVTAFFVPVAFQAAQLVRGRSLWAWLGTMVVLILSSLVASFGLLEGLARAMSPSAFVFALPVFLLSVHETAMARQKSDALLRNLQETNLSLRAYAREAADLAGLQERARLASELHDRVSQLIFGITLTASSTQLLLGHDPPRAEEQLKSLGSMTQSALTQLRSLITERRS